MNLKKVEKKVSLNIKISSDMDLRLKRARQAAREQGMIFNVSKEVESFLEKELKKVEKHLSIEQNIKEDLNQMDLLGSEQA
jgi:ABC-type Zn2+ transport system substrate-binding protein/surface adhesin